MKRHHSPSVLRDSSELCGRHFRATISEPPENNMFSAATASRAKAAARVALLGVDDASADVLANCFRQFGVDPEVLVAPAPARISDTFSACVVPLNREAEPVLRELRRTSHDIVLYGICASAHDASRFAKWGINAIFHMPVHESEALQVVRSTHLLLLKELRRYVRVPLVCPVTLETGTQVIEASSLEISAGGMLLTASAALKVSQAVLASFALPGAQATSVRSVVAGRATRRGPRRSASIRAIRAAPP